MDMDAQIKTNNFEACNIIASTKAGIQNASVAIGGHLDTVPLTVGANDDGSGATAVMLFAKKFAELGLQKKIVNRVVFALWFGEEYGKIGSTCYVKSLGARPSDKIAAYINLDMIASMNYAHQVPANVSTLGEYGVDKGCEFIEQLLVDYFVKHNIPVDRVAYTTSSDHWSFIQDGIPASRVTTGAGVIKTSEQQQRFGGISNAPFDTCYHQPCDNFDNVHVEAFEVELKASSSALYKLAMTENLRKVVGLDP
jgi:Zn-dependent M28 family amino/carboxypeptidase